MYTCSGWEAVDHQTDPPRISSTEGESIKDQLGNGNRSIAEQINHRTNQSLNRSFTETVRVSEQIQSLIESKGEEDSDLLYKLFNGCIAELTDRLTNQSLNRAVTKWISHR